MPFTSGENVGAYRIVEKLGQGGMATIFKAYHPALDRYVAIKVMHPALASDPSFMARFQREARIVANLDHPNIVPVYDFSQHRGKPYLVMRFIEGETLKAHMKQGPLDRREILHIARAVGQALAYACEQGVLHRDIKPSNILLTPDGDVYLTDFGLARMAEAGESTLSHDRMLGTPQYISPEQAKGMKELDTRTDIYSMGVVLYEMLVGRPPFAADTPYAVIHDHIFTPLPLPGELNADLPESAERVLLKALAKNPDARFQSAKELIDALEVALEPIIPPSETEPAQAETVVVSPEALSAPPPMPTPSPAEAMDELAVDEPAMDKKEQEQPRSKKRRWLWIMAGAALLICLIGGALGWIAIRHRRKTGIASDTEQVDQPTDPEEIQEILEEAQSVGEEGDFDSALDLYRQAAEADPHLIPAYMGASGILIKMGDVDQAIKILLEGIEANPEAASLHKRLAVITLLNERWDTANRERGWLLEKMPDEAFSHAYAAALMLAEGESCERARPELDIALQIDSDMAWSRYGLALCHLQEGDPGAARAELELVLNQEDTSPFLRWRAGQQLRRLEQGPQEIIEQEFEELLTQVEEIPDQELRMPLNEMLNQASEVWQQGEGEHAVQVLEDTRVWILEHEAELGAPLVDELVSRLEHIIHLANEAEQP